MTGVSRAARTWTGCVRGDSAARLTSVCAVVLVAAGNILACDAPLLLSAGVDLRTDGDHLAARDGDPDSAADTHSPSDSGPAGDGDSQGDVVAGDASPGDSAQTGDDPSPGDPPLATGPCADQVRALADAMAQAGNGCAGVVRFSLFEHELLGFQLLCGPYQTIDEEQALDLARSEGRCGYSGARVISPPDPDDAYVFYVPALDLGCGAVVSSETGLTLFAGSFIWQGDGDITYPASWRDPSLLGSACAAQSMPASVRGYNLVVGEDLSAEKTEAALADVAGTALPDALALRGELRSAVILEYPRRLGVYDGRTAEWIVILNGGQLR